MKALVWHGPHDVRVDDVPDPTILDAGDAIVRITSTAICGSDLHLYNGWVPTMRGGDILGHEPMGVVEEVGADVRRLKPGDRVVVPGVIACGRCFYCSRELYSLCDDSNPNGGLASAAMGGSSAALFGYSHAFGGYAGGQAEYLRVPFADFGPMVIPPEVGDADAVLLSDVAPTGWQAAELADIEAGDTVAVWGAGPIGQMAARSAFLQGAAQVVVIDQVPERLEMAAAAGAIPVDDRDDVLGALRELTAGRGPDRCIEAVGTESHGGGLLGAVDRVTQTLRVNTDRPAPLREAIIACRKGGTVSVAGVYLGYPDKLPMGAFMNKGLTMRSGQVHVQRYLRPLLERILAGELRPSEIVTDRVPLRDAADAYRRFAAKSHGAVKIVLDPAA